MALLPVVRACVRVGPPLSANVALTLVGAPMRPVQTVSLVRLPLPVKVAPEPAVHSRGVPPAGLLAMMLALSVISAFAPALMMPVPLLLLWPENVETRC